MVRTPYIDRRSGMKKGAWSHEEDAKLRAYIQRYGHCSWRLVPICAGLARCGKSCRLRWMNYLKPGVKHGNFTKHEEDLIITFHSQFGNKWSLIAAKLPGRTDNEIKNHWHSHLKKRINNQGTAVAIDHKSSEVIRSNTSTARHHHQQQEEQLVYNNGSLSPDQDLETIDAINLDVVLDPLPDEIYLYGVSSYDQPKIDLASVGYNSYSAGITSTEEVQISSSAITNAQYSATFNLCDISDGDYHQKDRRLTSDNIFNMIPEVDNQVNMDSAIPEYSEERLSGFELFQEWMAVLDNLFSSSSQSSYSGITWSTAECTGGSLNSEAFEEAASYAPLWTYDI